MKMTLSDLDLVRQYTEKHSEDAFATLVQRHVNLVYSAALRQTRSPQLAEEVSQSVFTDLAKSAPRLARNTVLTAWLYQVTRRTAIDVVRREARRQLREQIAIEMNAINATATDWTHIEPLLDEAMQALDDHDRTAILLRYFENKSLREVGEALGTSDDTAQKRVSRAVERLREFFAKRGIGIGAAGLVAIVSANAVQAAPAGLAATIVTATIAGTTLATTISATTTKAIAMTMTQKIVVAAAFAACVGTPLVIQHRAQSQLRIENELLRAELNQQAQLAEDNQRLSNMLAQVTRTNPQSLPKAQFDELLRLRGEVGRLRAQARESAARKPGSVGAVETLLAQLRQMPEKSIPELELLDGKKWAEDATRGNLDTPDGIREALANLRRAAKIRFAYDLSSALSSYLQASNGQLPATMAELKPYFKNPPDERPVDDTVFQRYQLLHAGNMSDVPTGEPIIVERAPVDDEYDTQFKIWANGYTVQGTGKWSGQPVLTNVWNTAAVAGK